MHELPIDLSRSKILVVDDVPANLDVLCQSLEAADYQVMVAPSGAWPSTWPNALSRT